VPCTVVRGTRPARVRVHGNMGRGLGTLGGMITLEWHGHCAMQGGSEVAASRGIDRGRVGKLDGEVTGLEVVGAGPARVGVLCKHGIDPRVSEGYRLDLYSVGSRER
jgi:hypothetical protein